MYDQRGQEIAGPAQAAGAVEATEATEAAREQSTEVCTEPTAAQQALVEACRAGQLKDILQLAVETPGGVDVLLKTGDAAAFYPEGPLWPQVLARLEQGASTLSPLDRLNVARLAHALPEQDRRDILERVFGLPLDELAGAERLDAEALAALADQAARLSAPVEGEEEVEAEAAEAATAEAQSENVQRTRNLSTQATLARIGLGARTESELAEPAQELSRALRHEIGHELYFKQEGAAADTLREEAGWQTVSPQEFVEACEPQAQDVTEAVEVMEARFGEGRDPEVVVDKGDPDMESAWWNQVEGLRERFPNLVAALHLTRYNKQLQRKAVRGGFAHANFTSSTLSIISPDLYQRLGQWSNPTAMISDKEWAAELYNAWFTAGASGAPAPDWLGPAEQAYLDTLRRQYPTTE